MSLARRWEGGCDAGHAPPWFVEECSTPDCWCAVITTKPGSDGMEHCVIPSGTVSREDAARIVEAVNVRWAMAADSADERKRRLDSFVGPGEGR